MFQIVSDGGCDFTIAEAREKNVTLVPFYIILEEKSLKEESEVSRDEYFNRMAKEKGFFAKTSQPNPEDYENAFKSHLENGFDVLAITISSKLSGSYNSAMVAAETMAEKFPDGKIFIIDSLNGSVGQSLIVREAIKMRDNNISAEEAAALTEKVKNTARVYFTLDSLEYLRRSGRVGPTTALVGGILGLRPVLHLEEGSVAQLDSVRGKKRVIQLMVEGVVATLEEEKNNVSIIFGHVRNEADAITFKEKTSSALGIEIDNPITQVGAAIGTHTGPGAITVAYCKKYEAV